jgi:putative SOS response-associated peptidase YedK
MCGRFTLKTPVANWLADLFPEWNAIEFQSESDLLASELTTPRYNIAPSQSVVVVYRKRDGELALSGMRWGLLPSWADALSVGYNMINARSESLLEKPSFRPALVDKRCVILADGYYEWRKLDAKTKRPYWIHRPGETVFAMAGLWARNSKISSADSPGPIESATIITTASNEDTQTVHDRMPAMLLSSELVSQWLDPVWNSKERVKEVVQLLQPSYPKTLMLRAVSTAVNSPKNQGPSLIEPVQDDLSPHVT